MQPTMQKNNVKQRKTIAIIAMIAVAAIALAAVAIIAVSNKREMTQAASDTCALNAKALATHQESFEEAQQEAEEAAKLTVNDVADGTTLETLKDAITLAKAVESAPACPRKRQCQRLHQSDGRHSQIRRQPAQHHQRTRRGRQVGGRQPRTQTRVRRVSQVSRPDG